MDTYCEPRVAMVSQPSCFLRTYDRLIERLQRQRFTSALNRPAPTRQSVRREHIGHKSGVEKPPYGYGHKLLEQATAPEE